VSGAGLVLGDVGDRVVQNVERSGTEVARSSVLWARSDREVVDLLKDGQLVLVCSVGDAVAEAAGAVERLSRESGRLESSAARRRNGSRS
jgi:hypothetical protein